LADSSKYSRATIDVFNKFQTAMLVRTGIITGEFILIVIILATLRPNAAGPFFLIPIGVMAVSILTYAVLGFAGCWKIVRSSASDRKRRRQGLPLDIPESGIDGGNHHAGPATRQ